MRDRFRFLAFGAALLVVFGVALGIGLLVGNHDETPSDSAAGEHGSMDDHGSMGDMAHGLQPSESGYTLTAITAPEAPNRPGRMQFRITKPDGAPLTEFATLHDQQLHLIAARTDTTEYRHVHPTMAPDGTWSIDWTWAQPGTYRVFADFQPDTGSDNPGELVLSRTVQVAGNAAPQPIPPVSRTALVDGYQVTLTGEVSTAGSMLRFDITRDGRPVTDLAPYLGAYAHLVALRTDDLAYLHVHPQGEIGSTPPGPDVVFHAEAPSAATYRLFLDFAHAGKVHTAEFTATAAETTDTAPMTEHHMHGN